MFVINRRGETESFDFSQTTNKIKSLCNDLNINSDLLTKQVLGLVQDGMKTTDIDILTSRLAHQMVSINPDYNEIAYRISYNNLIKSTPDYEEYLIVAQIRPEIKKIMKDINPLEWNTNYLGLFKLIDSYLLKDEHGVVYERPHFMLARVAAEISDNPQLTQEYMAKGYFIHSSPTNFNAGTKKPQMASCYLLDMIDSAKGITKTKSEALLISAKAGGIGINLGHIRPKNERIASSNGLSSGIIPIMETLNSDSKLFDQGGKRPASYAVYCPDTHAEISSFILAKNENSSTAAKDLFYGLWLSDDFYKAVEQDLTWKLTAKDLVSLQGENFTEAHRLAKTHTEISARKLWMDILLEQCGNRDAMYICNKGIINRANNVKNIGPILCSNLCTEIMEPVSKNESAVCNLVSISLPACIIDGCFDFNLFRTICYECVKNENHIIDRNYYINKKTSRANMHYRPIGIGYQGLHDMFINLGIVFGSEESKELMFRISEHMYFNCLEASYELAKKCGSHVDFEGTDLSKGIFHWEHFELTHLLTLDWSSLRSKVMQGVRNGLLIALMPTASSSHFLGNSPSFEPYTSLIYKRRIKGSEFTIINKQAFKYLNDKNLWVPNLEYIKSTGRLPENIDIPLFKTAFDLEEENLDMAIIRQPFIDQSQSLNWFILNPTPAKLNTFYFKAWRNNLKTSSYYIHKKEEVVIKECSSCTV